MRIGILGGTFNPIHLGHLILAEEAIDLVGLEKIIFIPCYIPPHKSSKGIIQAAARLKMVNLAIGSNARFSVSDIEAKVKRKSYTINTLRALKKVFPMHTDFFLIVGSDALEELPRWKNFKEIQKLAKVIVAVRPGFKAAKKQYTNKLIKISQLGISSSDIRMRVKKGFSIRYLVPDKVEGYIRRNSLYR
ncbi:MAG: nicotinate-nucleotide adenylyltransferase, partial [Candidatus Omnitrophica bacterium]|nr:nicotinate-nucleotide adenylyltransferase [Candidatus Omnitrophota bacterium]